MPGFGTGVGGIDVSIAADKVRQAYGRSLAANLHELQLPTIVKAES
jgi:hypothetical protein